MMKSDKLISDYDKNEVLQLESRLDNLENATDQLIKNEAEYFVKSIVDDSRYQSKIRILYFHSDKISIIKIRKFLPSINYEIINMTYRDNLKLYELIIRQI